MIFNTDLELLQALTDTNLPQPTDIQEVVDNRLHRINAQRERAMPMTLEQYKKKRINGKA